MKRFWNWLTHRVEDPPGDDYYFCGICGYVPISDPCSHLKENVSRPQAVRQH